MTRVMFVIAVVTLIGCGSREAVERAKHGEEDAAYLAMDIAARAEQIEASSSDRKFELLSVDWNQYHPTRVGQTTNLFAPHFLELRQPMLEYLNRPKPDPAVLSAMMAVIRAVAGRGEHDVVEDAELKGGFMGALNRVDPEDPAMGFLVVWVPAVWPDVEVPGSGGGAGSGG